MKMNKVFLRVFFMLCLLMGVASAGRAIETKVRIELKGWKDKLLYTSNFDYGKYRNIATKEFNLEKTHGVVDFQLDLDRPILLVLNNYFDVFLTPGDNLSIHADVTHKGEGMKIMYEGQGKENNQFLREIMNIYFHHFPEPLSEMYKPEISVETIVARYDEAILRMKNKFEEGRQTIHPSLDRYLYTFLQLILPNQLNQALMTCTGDNTTLIRKYEVPINQIHLYIEGYYDVNFLPYISQAFNEFIHTSIKIKSLDERVSAIEDYYNKLDQMSEQKEVVEGIRFYFLSIVGESLLGKNPEKLQPLVVKFQETYPGMMADNIQQWYQAKVKLAPGQEPPAIDLLDINGKKFSFDSYKGKVVYVDFWASWCGPCRHEMKKGAPALHHKFMNKEVVFVYISIDEKEANWKKAIQEDKIKGTHLIDLKGQVAKIYDITAVPHYILIGKDGKIITDKAPRPTDPRTAALITEALLK